MGRRSQAVSRASLRAAQDRFIAAWGQMGSNWGVSRTMAEVHALLYITAEALNTDDVMERLAISRGNASMSLRALVEWGLVQRVHKRGDRKEYFEAEQDPWTFMRRVVRERLRRELHPALALLFETRDMTALDRDAAASTAPAEAVLSATPAPAPDLAATPIEVQRHNDRLDALLNLLQTADKLGERFVGADGKGLRLVASVLSKIP